MVFGVLCWVSLSGWLVGLGAGILVGRMLLESQAGELPAEGREMETVSMYEAWRDIALPTQTFNPVQKCLWETDCVPPPVLASFLGV